ncbi:MAG: gliding motility protein GldM [Dysgonamonadaceae bacterium]|jgi:gliding motility-associated protein GldM|nr:gliding motility protein GldM [Dysgonamonadaceae bacterium]
MAVNNPNSPRQKMINLMYLVFIGMLALNVSSEVLDGFELVEERLLRSVKSSTTRNQMLFEDLDAYHKIAPDKTKVWYDLAKEVKSRTDSLCNYISNKKLEIVRAVDGEDGNPENLEHPDDLNAAFEVMMASGKTGGKDLKNYIDQYRSFISGLLEDSIKREIVESDLTTNPSKKAKKNKQSWEESMFWQMPLAAAVTLMTKMQHDIRNAEGEALSTLLKNVDVGDFRVNQIMAVVIPQTQVVMRGGNYVANISLSAVDSTQRPKIVVNGITLPEGSNGLYRTGTSRTGSFPVKGFIEMGRQDGSMSKYPFETEYFVVEPNATIAPTLMNVLYAGYPNPVRIAVPGVPSQNIRPSMTNGTLTQQGDVWIAKPAKVGVESVISVEAKIGDGNWQNMARTSFRVRALPDPLPYLNYTDETGNIRKFKGGKLAKSQLVAINEVKAAIDDDLLNISYSVLRFEMLFFDSMGTVIPEVSNGANFSERQKDYIRRLSKGKMFLIRGVIARGPDGIDRAIPPIEITVN